MHYGPRQQSTFQTGLRTTERPLDRHKTLKHQVNMASAATAQSNPPRQKPHTRTSSHPQPAFQSFDSYEILRRDLASPTSDRKKGEDALNKLRPSLLPYQEYHSGYSGADEESADNDPSYVPSWGGSKHTRHQSFTNFIPTALKSRTPSPIRKTPQQVVHTTEETGNEMGLTGDGRSRRGTEDTLRGGLPNWLNGGSIRGLPQSMEGLFNPESKPSTPNASPRKNSLATLFAPEPTTPTAGRNTVTSRWMSAISTRLALPQSPANAAPNPALDDELCTMNLETALFPSGSPTDRDVFSPAAYKNLQLNAMGLLTKVQNAYRQKTLTLREMEAERAAHRDEIEEAVTRATHLKLQLEGMASKALEQELAMRDLMDQLMAEKKAARRRRSSVNASPPAMPSRKDLSPRRTSTPTHAPAARGVSRMRATTPKMRRSPPWTRASSPAPEARH